MPLHLLNGFWGKESRRHNSHLTHPRALRAHLHPPALPWVGAHSRHTAVPQTGLTLRKTQHAPGKTHLKPFQDLSRELEVCWPHRATSRLGGRLTHLETDVFSAEARAVSCWWGRAEPGQGPIGQAGLRHTSLHKTQTGTCWQATAVPKPQWRISMSEGNQWQADLWPRWKQRRCWLQSREQGLEAR